MKKRAEIWEPTKEELDEIISCAGPKHAVNRMCKEVMSTEDSKKAAELVQKNNWIIVNAAFQANGNISWFLMRI